MEFLVQRSENANPPTLFLALSNILKESTEQVKHINTTIHSNIVIHQHKGITS